jgi:pimeloyl-ACP methyl ester carboxylesterase
MPAPPFPYRAIDVAFDNPAGPSHLAGTLTLPSGSGPFPAALLVSGSGQQDRDETLMGHKPFLVLADYLTRRGIAVLRVDDRGVGGSTGDVLHATSADFAGDAEAALAFLKSRPEIAPARIGIVGHSEGGMIGAMAAAKSPLVAWLVTMAGPGVRGHELILAQQRLIWAAAGETAPQLDKREKVGRAVIAALIEAPTEVDARDRARAILTEAGYADAVGDQAIAMMASDWYRYLLRYDPAPALRQLRIPVLAVNGSLDLQVPAKENLPAIRAALKNNRDATIVELPGLNHLFQPATTGAVGEYRDIETTIAPAALDTMTEWIRKRFGKP